MDAGIINKDTLRAEVEAASGGKQTVLYTAKGQPTYMNVMPAFNCEELGPGFGTGLHPAFMVGGVAKPEIFIGTYQAVIIDGEAISQPSKNPTCSVTFDAARAACATAGTGFHLMTNWEWAALALWCAKNGFGKLHGNTDYGKSHLNAAESGTVCEYGKILTGSGPDAWRHDGTPFGVADLVGNVWEWNDGLKLVGGKIVMPADNNYILSERDWPDTGVKIDAADGLQISDELTDPNYNSAWFKDISVKEGYTVPDIIRQSLLCPTEQHELEGYTWADSNENFEALPIRGGCWGSDDYAGLGALDLGFVRSYSSFSVGFRPAFIG